MELIDRLRGGDRRSIGRAEELVAELLVDPGEFPTVVAAMFAPDPLVAMRAADVAEKVTALHPELLAPHKDRILGNLALLDRQEVRWHVALMLPRLDLSPGEREEAQAILTRYLSDRSLIVQVNAMQGLADLAVADDRLRSQVLELIEARVEGGAPSVRARARKLLDALRGPGP